jgi:CHASE2 domain-containing sensor protein
LRHPNIVTIHDSGLTSGRYYYVMEYVHGQPLHDYLSSHPLTVDQKLRLFATICSALVHAHQHGVIHRDLKPGNILIDARGEPHVVDFGLAKTSPVSALRDGSPVTATSQFLGTLAYASPEQTLGAPEMVDARSDVYSLGVVLFEMLTGQLPYRITSDMVASLQTVRDAAPARPSSLNRELNTELDTITLRALSKEPMRRYQTVADLGADIERYLAGEPILARRDSITYIIRKRSTAMMRRHQLTMMASVALLATMFMWVFAGDIFTFWQWPLGAFESLASRMATPAVFGTPAGASFEDIRLIAINDDTAARINEMAQSEGFTDVNESTWRSVRRLHGRLMTRLAQAGINGLVWDISFPVSEPYNKDFVAGVTALREANVNPVIGVDSWSMRDNYTPELMAPDILATGVEWGVTTIGSDPVVFWRSHLIVHRSESIQMPGLALAGVAAARYPDKQPDYIVDSAAEIVYVRYLPRRENETSSSEPIPWNHFELSSVRPLLKLKPEEVQSGLKIGDQRGEFAFVLPDDATMARVRTPYHEAFFMDAEALKQRFGGKMVIVADQRSEPTTTDWADAPDGRRVHGAWAHAATMDALHRKVVTLRHARGLKYFLILLFGAVAGVLAAHRVPLRFFSISWRLAAGLAAFIAFGLVLFRMSSDICSPVLPFTTMVLGFVGLMIVERLGGRETTEGRKGSMSWTGT